MGGKSSSSSSSSTTTNTITPQVYGSPGSNVIAGNRGPVHVTDGGAFDLAGQLVEGTINESRSAREDALMFAGEAATAMREGLIAAQENGYTFAGEATGRAFEGMERSQEMGYQYAGEAMNRSLDLIDSDRNDTFAFLGEAFQSAMDANADNSDRLQELARQTSANLMQNTQYAMDEVAEANESDNIEYMRLMLMASAGLVAFIAWSNAK